MFLIEPYDFPINREIFLHKRTCETSHKYNHIGKKDTRQRRRNKILSRSQKALPRKAYQLFARSCLNVKIVSPLKTRVVNLIVCSMLIFMYELFFSTKISIFTSFKRVSVFSLSCSFGRRRTLCVGKKKAKENVGYLFSKSVGVYFSLLLDDFALLNRVFKVKIVFFFSESFIIFHYYSFFVVACWLLFSFRGTYIKLCVLYTVHE